MFIQSYHHLRINSQHVATLVQYTQKTNCRIVHYNVVNGNIFDKEQIPQACSDWLFNKDV